MSGCTMRIGESEVRGRRQSLIFHVRRRDVSRVAEPPPAPLTCCHTINYLPTNMPTYGYKCPKCGHEYEKFQKMSDTTRAKCPNCGTRGQRVISGGAGVVFKGSGFYETDYKRASAG